MFIKLICFCHLLIAKHENKLRKDNLLCSLLKSCEMKFMYYLKCTFLYFLLIAYPTVGENDPNGSTIEDLSYTKIGYLLENICYCQENETSSKLNYLCKCELFKTHRKSNLTFSPNTSKLDKVIPSAVMFHKEQEDDAALRDLVFSEENELTTEGLCSYLFKSKILERSEKSKSSEAEVFQTQDNVYHIKLMLDESEGEIVRGLNGSSLEIDLSQSYKCSGITNLKFDRLHNISLVNQTVTRKENDEDENEDENAASTASVVFFVTASFIALIGVFMMACACALYRKANKQKYEFLIPPPYPPEERDEEEHIYEYCGPASPTSHTYTNLDNKDLIDKSDYVKKLQNEEIQLLKGVCKSSERLHYVAARYVNQEYVMECRATCSKEVESQKNSDCECPTYINVANYNQQEVYWSDNAIINHENFNYSNDLENNQHGGMQH